MIQQGRGGDPGGASETALEQDATQAARAIGGGTRAQVRAHSAPHLARRPSASMPPGVSLVEISCAINEIRFHTARRVVSYELTDCDLDNGEYQAHVVIDRRKRSVRFDLGEDAPKGVRFRFNYLVGPDQPAPIDLLAGQSTVHVVASNLPPRQDQAAPPPQAAPDLTANVAHISPEEAQRRCDSHDLSVKTFPFRGTRFGAAPIDAWRDGPYIRVKQPVYVMANDDFRRQVRTLPVETFTSGVRLYPDEIVRVHVYEPRWYKLNITGSTDGDREHEFCVTGEQMLEIANASTRATIFNIALTGVEAATLFVPVGKLAAPLVQAGRTGLAATMIATADVAPTALGGVASRAATTIIEEQAETRIVGQALQRTVAASVAEREVTQAVVPRAVAAALPRAGAGLGTAAAHGAAAVGTDLAGGAVHQAAAPSPLPSIAGAEDVRVAEADYRAALELGFPGQFADRISVAVDGIGRRAAQRAVADARFVAAVQSGNRTLAGTLFHSAAATEARALPASALPGGWVVEAERVIQAGAGGSRSDVLLRGPAGEIIEFDWKTTGGSALSYGSRREMTRHAGQLITNIGGQLTRQESRSWIDYVRPLMPGVDW